MLSKLDQLKKITDVVADTGDIEAIRQYQPLDATTNPSLLLKASALSQYQPLLLSAVQASQQDISTAARHFAVNIGKEILNIIPGKISTEVDARLSFDTLRSIEEAKKIIGLYEAKGIDRDRILIKIASTWEGIQTAKALEKEGIHCNLTLLFSFEQAAMAADVGAFLISPFVGRILDWYKKATGQQEYASEDDPGVQSVSQIYHYYKSHGYGTVVMGASFRNTGEIEALAGCDRLTISPALLAELSTDKGVLTRQLSPDVDSTEEAKIFLDETGFRYQMNQNAMATEKLAEGIRQFIIDQEKLENVLAKI